ncbi:Chlorophyllase, partial [Trinorchestia longiramus]
HSVVHVRYNSTVYAPGLPVHLSAWAPAESGIYPIVYFFSGFQATTPVEIYGDVIARIASHGYVVAAPWNLTTKVYPEQKIDEMQQVFDWTYDNLDALLIEAGAASDMVTDYDTAFAMSHSSGAHLICSYLQLQGCYNFKGMTLTSPVDGVDP